MAHMKLQPLEFLISDVKILLILLNQPIESNAVLTKLLKNAVLKVCCDGAANRLHDFNNRHKNNDYRGICIPDFICGDLDSVREDVLNDFKKNGAEVVCLEDQNATDFTKGTLFAIDHCKTVNIDYDLIVAYPAMGGRLDQTLSNINTLYTLNRAQSKPCYLLSDFDIACLLNTGKSLISVDTNLEGEWCGIVPTGCEANSVTSTGLKYNLCNDNMLFGGLISTSNSIADGTKEVSVETSHPVLWILGYTAENVC